YLRQLLLGRPVSPVPASPPCLRCARGPGAVPRRADASPRDLPPFPTRRSSDLTAPGTATRNRIPNGTTPWSNTVTAGRCGSNRRSEEHTSELQSRFDIVCRLLLEKKNDVAVASARASPPICGATSAGERSRPGQ